METGSDIDLEKYLEKYLKDDIDDNIIESNTKVSFSKISIPNYIYIFKKEAEDCYYISTVEKEIKEYMQPQEMENLIDALSVIDDPDLEVSKAINLSIEDYQKYLRKNYNAVMMYEDVVFPIYEDAENALAWIKSQMKLSKKTMETRKLR